jgi:protein-S-isoprenylcysteine O-methyltransferase Ste14
MFVIACLPIVLYFSLEFLRKSPMQEEKQNRGSSILIGAVLSWMIFVPILIHIFSDKETGFLLWIGILTGLTGVWIRSSAMKTLGRFYSRNVGKQAEHQIVQHGWYRYIRHPGYLGTFLTFLGFAVSSSSWLAVGINVVLFFIAYSYRIKVEEQALVAGFGDAYRQYQAKTWKLIPFLY